MILDDEDNDDKNNDDEVDDDGGGGGGGGDDDEKDNQQNEALNTSALTWKRMFLYTAWGNVSTRERNCRKKENIN